MNFDEWIYKVCEYNSVKYRRDITDLYSTVNLTDAKLAFIDGVSIEEYKI